MRTAAPRDGPNLGSPGREPRPLDVAAPNGLGSRLGLPGARRAEVAGTIRTL